MKQNHSLTFAILLAGCVLTVSRQFATNRLKGFIKNQSANPKHLTADHEAHGALRKTLQKLIGNEDDKSGSSSSIQYSRELLGLAYRSANPKIFVQLPKVNIGRDFKKESHVNRVSDANRIKRSANQSQEESVPGQVMARPHKSTGVILSWFQPSKLNPSRQSVYYIYYGTVSSGVSSVPVGSTTATTFVVGDLQQNVVYVFEVSLGLSGQHSYPVYSRTKSYADYQPVHSLKAVVINASSIVLTWEKPVDVLDPSIIRGYRIKMSYRDGSGAVSQYYNTTGRETSHTYTFLNFSTSYTFEVSTRFSKGDLGVPLYVVTTTDPFSASVGPLMATVDAQNTLILSWSAPRTIDLNKNLKHYRVTSHCPRCSGYGYLIESRTVNKTTFTFPNVQRSKTYSFSVQAETTFGYGEVSTTSVTISQFFGQVRNLSAGVDDLLITVQWDAPSDIDAKDIKYYVVRWCNSTSRSPYCSPYTVPWKSVNVTGGQTQFTIHGYAGDTFSICARVVATYGPGLQRSTCIRRIVPLLDLKVPYAWASKTGRYGLQMTVQWDKPKVSEHLQYEVRWHCVRGTGRCGYWRPQYWWNRQATDSRSLTINGGIYNRAYVFEVIVITSRGRGLPYQASTYIPPFGMPRNFACEVTADNIHLTCHWSTPTDVDPTDFQYYWFNYTEFVCNYSLSDCFQYRQVFNFNQTSITVPVTIGARYSAKIRVEADYTAGKSAQTTGTITRITPIIIGPVTQLNTSLDDKNPSLVHLSWKAPSTGSPVQFQYRIRITCTDCGTPRLQIRRTRNEMFSSRLQCGHTYLITVRALTYRETGADSQVVILIPSVLTTVKNLRVNFISRVNEKGFSVAWDTVKGLSGSNKTMYDILVKKKSLVLFHQKTASTTVFVRSPDPVSGQEYTFGVASQTVCGYGERTTLTIYYPELPTLPPTPSKSTTRRKWAQTTATTTRPTLPVSIGPVAQLSASLDDNNPSLVHLSWKAPSTSSPVQLQYQINITCTDCDTPQLQIWRTVSGTFSSRLHCGHTYLITVRALTDRRSGDDSQVVVLIPSVFATVRNLRVRISSKGSEKGFSVEWDPVKGLSGPNITEYDILVTSKSLVVFHHKTASTNVFVRSPDPVSGQEYTFGVASRTVCGYGERTTLTIYYPELPSPPTPPQSKTPGCSCSLSSTVTTRTTSTTHTTAPTYTTPAAYTRPPTYSTYAYTPTKPHSSLPLARLGHHKSKEFPYWSIPVALVGVVFVSIVLYLVYKYKSGIMLKLNVPTLPRYPPSYEVNVGEYQEMS